MQQAWSDPPVKKVSSNNLESESSVSQRGTPNATLICKYYAKNGVCKRYRSVCPFAHVDPKQKIDLKIHPKFILIEGKWEFEFRSRSASMNKSIWNSDEESEKSLQVPEILNVNSYLG